MSEHVTLTEAEDREPSALAEQYNAEMVRRLSAEAKVRAAEALAEEWEQTPETVKCYGLDRAHGSRLRAVLNRGGDR